MSVDRDCFPYEIKARGGSRAIRFARITCIRCNAHADRQIPGFGHNPEKMCKDFRDLGWECDWNHIHRTICPTCIKARRSKSPPPAPATVTPARPKETPAMSAPAVPAAPTNDQRLKIRTLLDKHFDDAKGRYLDGYTDQRVGAEVDVPWAAVTAIREAAYGPLRVDPEVDALQRAVAAIEADLAKVKERLAALVKRS